MAVFRYQTSGRWHKGGVHIHSTVSDGGKTPAELARMYADARYDFLCRTDHMVASDVAAEAPDAPLLWLDGVELDGEDDRGAWYHVVGLGTFTGISREMGFTAAMAAIRDQGGLLILAHPYWSGNSLEEALRWDFDGVEVYNHVCQWINGKGRGGAYWQAMLNARPNTLAFAVDDTHATEAHPGWNGGWIMVNAPECTRPDLDAALRAGNFYATTGPEFHAIESDGPTVRVRTSPVRHIRLVGPGPRGDRVRATDDRPLTAATFDVPPDWAWAYLELEDAQTRCARTNALFVAGP